MMYVALALYLLGFFTFYVAMLDGNAGYLKATICAFTWPVISLLELISSIFKPK
jgi:hypothetical protein